MFVFVISNFMKSSTVYAASLCTFVRFESMIWPSIRFDISLQNLLLVSLRLYFHPYIKDIKILRGKRKNWTKKNYSDKIVPEIDWDIGVFCAQKDSSKKIACPFDSMQNKADSWYDSLCLSIQRSLKIAVYAV